MSILNRIKRDRANWWLSSLFGADFRENCRRKR